MHTIIMDDVNEFFCVTVSLDCFSQFVIKVNLLFCISYFYNLSMMESTFLMLFINIVLL
jgi:hypothetical protein